MMNSLQQFHFPPREGFVLTHVLVVADQDRSRDYYQSVLGAQALRDRDPVILQLANRWLILNTGGDRTADKPTVTLTTPPDPDTVSAFMNIRVADIVSAHRECCAQGAQFLTDPVDHGYEIRGFIRDPDGSSRVANCMLDSLREWQ